MRSFASPIKTLERLWKKSPLQAWYSLPIHRKREAELLDPADRVVIVMFEEMSLKTCHLCTPVTGLVDGSVDLGNGKRSADI